VQRHVQLPVVRGDRALLRPTQIQLLLRGVQPIQLQAGTAVRLVRLVRFPGRVCSEGHMPELQLIRLAHLHSAGVSVLQHHLDVRDTRHLQHLHRLRAGRLPRGVLHVVWD
jgi:hypothetical protein